MTSYEQTLKCGVCKGKLLTADDFIESDNDTKTVGSFVKPSSLRAGEFMCKCVSPLQRKRLAELATQSPEVHSRVDDLVEVLVPQHTTELQRHFVFDYVGRLLSSVVPDLHIFPFGSNPLKTYLPDGDVDICVVSKDDNWFVKAREVLTRESRNPSAKLPITNVIYIPAKIKIIKALIGNIAVDISSNTVGGLGSLCFIEEVDRLIGQNHLAKRSIMLVKAWSYYESRILGSHNGLMSTYALEVLVLFILNAYHDTVRRPLQALYLFLKFFANFDWENYCLTVLGPVEITTTMPLVGAARNLILESDCLPLTFDFLRENQAKYASTYSQGSRSTGSTAKAFELKYMNIMDPLNDDNNLGRSVSQGNYFRIKRAFLHGAQTIESLIWKNGDVCGVDRFFQFVWRRHEGGVRPDLRVTGERRLSATGGRVGPDGEAMRFHDDSESLLFDIDESFDEDCADLETHFVFCERGGDMLCGRLDQMVSNFEKARQMIAPVIQGKFTSNDECKPNPAVSDTPFLNIVMTRPPWFQGNADPNIGKVYYSLPSRTGAMLEKTACNCIRLTGNVDAGCSCKACRLPGCRCAKKQRRQRGRSHSNASSTGAKMKNGDKPADLGDLGTFPPLAGPQHEVRSS